MKQFTKVTDIKTCRASLLESPSHTLLLFLPRLHLSFLSNGQPGGPCSLLRRTRCKRPVKYLQTLVPINHTFLMQKLGNLFPPHLYTFPPPLPQWLTHEVPAILCSPSHTGFLQEGNKTSPLKTYTTNTTTLSPYQWQIEHSAMKR